MIIFDSEIKHLIANDGELRNPKYKYASGWHDYLGMGIACVCAYDTDTDKMQRFAETEKDVKRFAEHGIEALQVQHLNYILGQTDYIVGYNNASFDNRLLRAFFVQVSANKSYDLYTEIIEAAGLSNAPYRDRKGYKLEQIALANGIQGKLEGSSGADAPKYWQDSELKRLIDYCEQDVLITWQILGLAMAGALICPRTGGKLDMVKPYDRLGQIQRSLI